MRKTVAEFFAGIGLMRLGLEQAGWEVAFANDIDETKSDIYQNHFKDANPHFLLGDVHLLSADEVPSTALATASFPCTDLSLAGRREGLSGKHSSAFWGFMNVLRNMGERRPPLVLLENVEGFLNSNKGNDLAEALLALNELGYAVDVFIINASHFVPQSRVRLFVVGQRSRVNGLAKDRQLLFYQSPLRPPKLAEFILDHPEINWDIRDLPPLPQRTIDLPDVVDKTPKFPEETWWSKERVQYLLDQTFERHRLVIEAAMRRDNYAYFTAFRRVRNGKSMAEIRYDGVAGCLRTPKGGSARQILLEVGKGEVNIRLLSPRECARLMGADDYTLPEKTNDALFGFGDAVCVPVVKWIGDNYLNPVLDELTYSHSSPIYKHEPVLASI